MKPLKIAKYGPFSTKRCHNCAHLERIKDKNNMFDHCECDIDGTYIGYTTAFECVCDDWRKAE